MRDRLPETIDTAPLKTSGREYRGSLSILGMQRLAESLRDTDVPDLQVSLYAGRDAGGVSCLQGQIEGVLHLTCQRCLERIEFPVKTEIRLALVHSAAEAERLAEGYEPLLVENERLVVRDVIEDELLLVLPSFALHDATEHCSLPEYRNETVSVVEEEKPNPFAALASLKRN
jgi:uncharacterized protein